MERPIDVSVIIVNYNVKHFAEQCLRSVLDAAVNLKIEIFLVDNNSTDGSLEYLRKLFPTVNYIANKENLGFGKANNQALKQASGRFFLILNPDTLIARDTLISLIDYLDRNPKVGAAGPKILTREGNYDIASKRGLPTPWVSFCKLSGLTGLFPKTKLFCGYNLQYLDPDKPAKIDALGGACMMIKQETYNAVGGFDEDFFMYGEDIDWCYRMALAGWEVHYAPVTNIVHFRGESTRRSNIDRDRAFYGAMHLFVDKHFQKKYPLIAHWSISIGIALAEIIARIGKFWRWVGWAIFDWIVIFLIMISGRWLRWGQVGLTSEVILALVIQTTIFVVSLSGFKVYGSSRGRLKPILSGLALGFLINSSFTYFFRQFGYSRFVNLFALVFGGSLILLSRAGVRMFRATDTWKRMYQRRTLIVGVGKTAERLVSVLRRNPDIPYHLVGLIDPDETAVGRFIDELPVLGSEDELARIAREEEIEEILFAYDKLDYDRALKMVERIGKELSVNFKVVSPDVADDADTSTPFLSLEYMAPRKFGRSLKMMTNIMAKH